MKTSSDFVTCSAASWPTKLVLLALKLLCCLTHVRGQFVASPSPVTFAHILVSKDYMYPYLRDYMYPYLRVPRLFDFVGRKEV